MKKRILLLSLVFLSLIVEAQIDNEFWFAAPDVSSAHDCNPSPPYGEGRPINLYVTAEQATNVKIEMPATPAFTPIEFSLVAGEHRMVPLSPPYSPDVFENYSQPWPLPPAQTIQTKGIRITSDQGNITAYYELNNRCNRDIFALKGKNALGKNFYVSTQNYLPNGTYSNTAYSGFVIVATEDNTNVTIYRNGVWQNFLSAPPQVITLTLNRGETFAFVASSTAPANHINGVHVTSDRDIAITWYDDSIRKRNNPSSYSYDICGDQLIPTGLIGMNYLVMKGNIFVGDDGGEKFFVTAIVNNTKVFVNGVEMATLNAGQVYGQNVPTPTTRISCTQPVYVNHMSGTGGGGELGGATLPTIDGCTGSHTVTFTRNNYSGDQLQINLMLRNITNPASPLKNKCVENCLLIIGANTYSVPKSYFDFIPDSSWAVLRWSDPVVANFFTSRIGAGTTATIYNPVALFHLGIQNGAAATGGKYGYFSDYSSYRGSAGIGGPKAPAKKTYCSLDPIMFAVEGGISYKWEGADFPDDTIYLSSTTSNEVYFYPPGPTTPAHPYKFKVTIERDCFGDTIIFVSPRVYIAPVANFSISNPIACSPYNPLITNQTDFALADNMLWDFDFEHKNTDTINQVLLPNPFHHLFPENITDTPQVFRIKLYAWAPFGECPSEREKTVTILPNVIAGFLADTNMGCNPLTVTFTDTTIGYLDTLNSYWDFDTYLQTYTSNPTHTFINGSQNNYTHNVRLIAFSIEGCTDTAYYPVTVHPYIKANFGIDNLIGCSPFTSQVNPSGSVGVSTYHWSVYDENHSYYDSAFVKNNKFIFPFTHNDTTQPNPDTLYISMYGLNAYNCPDTAIPKRMVIFPEVQAGFLKSETAICDSVDVDFINNSVGYKLVHDWDLGDGTSFVDTLGIGFTHRYFNRTLVDQNYDITLVTTSDYFCTDSFTGVITVHPFVRANFSIDFQNNCTPVDVDLSNVSLGGSQFDWDFGDGTADVTYATGTISHTFENNTDNDTTYYINMRATNTYGCADSMQRSIFLFPQVAANFDFGTSNVGCNPLPVSFINDSKGKNVNYNWDFGDKTSSTSQDPPPKLYQNNTAFDTTYYVTLTVTNPVGCDSAMTKPVQVYSKVTADFAISRLDSCSPFKIRVDNYSSGGIVDFIWKYTPTDSMTLHTFSDPDIPVYHNTTMLPQEYEFKLRTLNSHGCEAVKRDTVTVFPEVFARFTPDKLAGCEPLLVSFNNQTNIIPGTTFLWDYGDGKYSNKAYPDPHSYSNTNSTSLFRNIYMSAMTQYGCFDDTTIQVEIYPYIYANFTIDRPSICSGEPFEINRINTRGGINHYYWDYENDGSTDEEKTDVSFFHTYSNTTASSFNRQINLTVTNAQGCDTSWVEGIIVNPEVRAAFTIDDQEICYPHTTVFTNNSQPAVPLTYQWTFGDGSASTDKNPTHAYKNYSHTNDLTFTVNLTATSAFGCDSSVSRTLTVHPKPVADFTYPLTAACPPFTVPLTNKSIGNNLSYAWDFDNGNTSTFPNPSETYTNDGSTIIEKQIRLIVTTEFLCGDTIIRPIQVYPDVSADFTASLWNGCNPIEVDFNGTATNENEYYWYVDDILFSNYEDAYYRFVNETSSDKIFNVRFMAQSGYGCYDDTVKQVTVYPKPTGEFLPVPIVQDFDTINENTSVTFVNNTLNQAAWSYTWNFGDGTESSESAPSFVKAYSVWGDIHNGNRIPVSMIVNNAANPQCSDTVDRYIVINPPLPQVNLGPDVSGCMPLEVEFPSTTKYIYEDSYQWDFGYQGMTSTETLPGSIVFDTAGVYMIRLAVAGDGGTNWDYKQVIVYPKPVVDFTFSPELVLEESQNEPATPIVFFNTTVNGVNYWWDFGDENTSTLFEPTHIYADTGHYFITLVAESGDGCYDTLTHHKPAIVEGARLMEFPNAFVIDPGGPASEYYDPNRPDYRVFRPVTRGVEKYRLEIYNRWGELIFVSEDVHKGWNGYIKGEPAKQDVYVWKVNVTFTDGKPYVAAGDVTLLINERKKQ
ncbi:MAG: PKD domain-containing protein [Bacteroidales bacterium]|nr:PKD domain-containing protein [Bacteroidales bacterium]